MTQPSDNEAAAEGRWRSLAVVLGSAFAVGLTFGLSAPMLALVLDGAGASSFLIGLNSAVASLAVLVAGPFVPRLLDRLGTLPAMYVSVAGSMTIFLLLPLTLDSPAWFVLRFLLGACAAIHWIISETWINAVAQSISRGKVVGLYVSVVSAGFAVGPLLLNLVGSEGWLPFVVAAGLVFMSAVPLFFARGTAPRLPPRVPSSTLMALRLVPVVMLAAVLAGITDTTQLTLLHIYAIDSGIERTWAVTLLAVTFAGTVLLQIPIGWLSDHVGRFRLLVSFALVFLVIPMAFPFVLHAPVFLWPMAFAWGGVSMGFYTIGLALLGDRFAPAQLAGANAAFVALYEFGSIIGPVLGGFGMDLLGPQGLMGMFACAAAAFLVVIPVARPWAR